MMIYLSVDCLFENLMIIPANFILHIMVAAMSSDFVYVHIHADRLGKIDW